MSKRDELDNMQVVEIDAIDFGDWERNMATSEVEMTQLRTLIRETRAQPVVAQRRQPAPKPQMTTIVAPAPAPQPATARPSLVPAPPPELPPIDEPMHDVVDLRPRLPVPRWVVFAGSAIAGVLVMVVVILVQQSSPPAHKPAAPIAPRAAASPAAQPAATPVAVEQAPRAPSTRTAPAAIPTRTPPPPPPAATPAAPARVASKPAVSPTRAPAAAPVKAPTPRPKSVRRGRPTRKTVAVRSAPLPTDPTVDSDEMESARAAYAEGNAALFAGDSDAAIHAYLQVLELSPMFAFGQRGLGLAYAQKGDHVAAIKALREYLKLAPKAKDVPLIKKRIHSLQAAH